MGANFTATYNILRLFHRSGLSSPRDRVSSARPRPKFTQRAFSSPLAPLPSLVLLKCLDKKENVHPCPPPPATASNEAPQEPARLLAIKEIKWPETKRGIRIKEEEEEKRLEGTAKTTETPQNENEHIRKLPLKMKMHKKITGH